MIGTTFAYCKVLYQNGLVSFTSRLVTPYEKRGFSDHPSRRPRPHLNQAPMRLFNSEGYS